MTLFEPGKPLTFGDFTVTVLKSKHSPGSVGGDSTPITAPLSQPAGILAYYEGGSFDFLFEHGGRRALFKNSANFIPGALDDVRAETLFLGVATLSKQGQDFQNAFYDQTVGKVQPKLVVPSHWNNFFLSLIENLRKSTLPVDDAQSDLDFLSRRLSAGRIQFRPMQGFETLAVLN